MKHHEKPWTSNDLEQVYTRINAVSSEYERTRLILMAYRLHKAKQKSFLTSKIPESEILENTKRPTMKAFMEEAEQRTGLTKSTLYDRIKKGEALEKLDDRALTACLGTSLANKLGDLVRIAAIPKAEVQFDLVRLYDRQRSHAKSELEKWEACFSPIGSSDSQKNESGEAAEQTRNKNDSTENTKALNVEEPETAAQENRTLPVVGAR